jgi:hypothetical protein
VTDPLSNDHQLTRKREGRREMEKITPTCSCGWVGIGYEAHNDYQLTLVKEQEGDHLRAARNKTALDVSGDTK